MIRNSILAAAAAALLANASPAAGQAAFIPAVIGNTVGMMAAQGAAEERCLLNKRPAGPAAIAEARAGAEAAMRDYLRLAATAPSADVSAAFTAKAKLRFWLRNGKDTFVTQVEDPFAHAVPGAARAWAHRPTSSARATARPRSACGGWRAARASRSPITGSL